MGDYNPAVGSFPVPNSPRVASRIEALSVLLEHSPSPGVLGASIFFFSLEAGLKFETSWDFFSSFASGELLHNYGKSWNITIFNRQIN